MEERGVCWWQYSVAKMPDRRLSAGESSSSTAPPGTGATLDISVEVFGGPAAKVRGPLQRADPPRLETARPVGATLRRRTCWIAASQPRRRSQTCRGRPCGWSRPIGEAENLVR